MPTSRRVLTTRSMARSGAFMPNLSILDLLFNVGREAVLYLEHISATLRHCLTAPLAHPSSSSARVLRVEVRSVSTRTTFMFPLEPRSVSTRTSFCF
jgi:hypothetical protein